MRSSKTNYAGLFILVGRILRTSPEAILHKLEFICRLKPLHIRRVHSRTSNYSFTWLGYRVLALDSWYCGLEWSRIVTRKEGYFRENKFASVHSSRVHWYCGRTMESILDKKYPQVRKSAASMPHRIRTDSVPCHALRPPILLLQLR
jgi:hypothetical protein